jgi:hypothetical protein
VILATHSKEIINFVDPTRLILVESGSNKAAPVSDEVTPMAIMRSLGAIDNVDAYSLVRNRRCLFVEGSGDVSILGRFAATLGIRALTGDDRVVTVPVGGADRFEHVKQLDVFEEELKTATQDRLGQRYMEDVWRHADERVTLPAANETARTMIDENWDTIGSASSGLVVAIEDKPRSVEGGVADVLRVDRVAEGQVESELELGAVEVHG